MLSYSFCNIKTEKNYIQKKVLNIIRAIYTSLTIWKLLDYKKIDAVEKGKLYIAKCHFDHNTGEVTIIN